VPGKKKRKLSEDEAFEIALRDHPQWQQALENDELPDEMIGEDGQNMNPRAHLQIHAVVERQIAHNEPRGVVAVAQELARLGLSRHDIRHEIGNVLTEHIWYMTNEGCPFDEGRYIAELREVVRSHR